MPEVVPAENTRTVLVFHGQFKILLTCRLHYLFSIRAAIGRLKMSLGSLNNDVVNTTDIGGAPPSFAYILLMFKIVYLEEMN